MQSNFLNRYQPIQGLTYDFNVPIPVAEADHRPRVGQVYPGSYLRYSNKTKLDPTWVDRCEVRSDLEQSLRILNEELVEIDDNISLFIPLSKPNTERYGGLYKYANPMDAYYGQNITQSDVFYVIRDTALRLYHERRLAADHHPQIGMTCGRALQAKIYDETNKVAKKAAESRKDRKGSWRKIIKK